MAEKKPTKVHFIFEHHTPEMWQVEKEKLKDADFVFMEISQEDANTIKNMSQKEIDEVYRYSNHPLARKFNPHFVSLVNSLSSEGKTIIGNDFYKKDRLKSKILDITQKMPMPVTLRARLMAKGLEIREKSSAEDILEKLKNGEVHGKVYVTRGATHTPLMHEVIRKLKDENVPVTSEHLNARYLKDDAGNMEEIYDPFTQLVRAYRMKVKSITGNKEKMANLKQEISEYNEYINKIENSKTKISIINDASLAEKSAIISYCDIKTGKAKKYPDNAGEAFEKQTKWRKRMLRGMK